MNKQKLSLLKLIAFCLSVVILATLLGRSVMAQSQPDPKQSKEAKEAEELKARLQQLEQTVRELKTQIESIETKKTTAAEPAVVNGVYTPPAPSGTATETEPANPKSAQDASGERTFEIYGFAMMDAGYQIKQNDPAWFDVIRPTKLPSFPNEFAPNGQTYFSVRQSRLGVKSSAPTKYGDFRTQFEFELFGTGVDAGQTTFRLRHAYGELGQFGAGQTWSPFMDIDVFPNSLEYWGPNGMVFFRNVHFRWMPLRGRNSVTIGIERPGASADQGRFEDRIELTGIRPKSIYPTSPETCVHKRLGLLPGCGNAQEDSVGRHT